MDAIRDQRAIIDRRGLDAALAAIVEDSGDPGGEPAVLAELKRALAAGRAAIRRRFDEQPDGRAVARETCFLIDQLVRSLHDFTTTQVFHVANPSAGELLCLVAVGGYGRGELAPCSDVDLLFFGPTNQPPLASRFVGNLWSKRWTPASRSGRRTRRAATSSRLSRAAAPT